MSTASLRAARTRLGASRVLRWSGFAGLAIDQEIYPEVGGVTTASWEWDYAGNSHSEAEVRAKVRQRGRQLMRSMVQGFPITYAVGGRQYLAVPVGAPQGALTRGVNAMFVFAIPQP